MQKHLASRWALAPSSLLAASRCGDPRAAAQAYQQRLAAAGGGGAVAGIGQQWPRGFNEPLWRPGGLPGCAASAATRAQNAGLFGGDPQQVPEAAITLVLKDS